MTNLLEPHGRESIGKASVLQNPNWLHKKT
jgi:hypothetical protein